jgi:hypothetical protein
MKFFVLHGKVFAQILIIAILLQCVATVARAEDNEKPRVVNVWFETRDNNILIHFDLIASKESKYKTGIILRKERDSTYSYLPKDIEGDIGGGVLAGQDRIITWNPSEEFPQGLEGKDYFFEITAVKMSKSSFSIPWVGIGLAAIAGTAAIWYASSVSGDDTPHGTPPSFPAPPGRPH